MRQYIIAVYKTTHELSHHLDKERTSERGHVRIGVEARSQLWLNDAPESSKSEHMYYSKDFAQYIPVYGLSQFMNRCRHAYTFLLSAQI